MKNKLFQVQSIASICSNNVLDIVRYRKLIKRTELITFKLSMQVNYNRKTDTAYYQIIYIY